MIVPVEVVGADDKTRLVVEELVCVVAVDEVETEEGGVSAEGPAKPVLSIVKPVFGGLGWTSGYTGENLPALLGELLDGVTVAAPAGEKGRKG